MHRSLAIANQMLGTDEYSPLLNAVKLPSHLDVMRSPLRLIRPGSLAARGGTRKLRLWIAFSRRVDPASTRFGSVTYK
jgi:hypothetical protein